MAEASPMGGGSGAFDHGWRALYLEPGEGALASVRDGLTAELTEKGLSPNTAARYASYTIQAEEYFRARGTTVLTATDETLARYALSLSAQMRRNARPALRHFFRLYGRPATLPPAFGATRHQAKGWPAGKRPGHKAGSPHFGHEWEGEPGPPAERVRASRVHMRRKGLGPRTIGHYSSMLWRAERWAGARGRSLAELDADELGDYSDTLGAASRRSLRSALRHYYAATGTIDPPIGAIRVGPKRRMVAHPLEDIDARRLFELARADTGKGGTAVLLGLLLGLRCAEIAKLRFDDFDEDGRWVRFVGKGDLDASLPVPPMLRECIAALPRGSSSYLFPGQLPGKHVNPTTVWNWVRDLGADAGIEGLYTHKLRHTCLTIANDATGDLRGVQEFARHADPDTTAGYTRVTGARLTSIGEVILRELGHDEPEPAPALPTLPFAALVAGMLGAEAVEPWVALATAIAGRPGWELGLAPDGHRSMHFRFGDRLWATAEANWTSRPAQFVIFQQLSDDEDDAAWWDFGDPESLVAMLSPFEACEILPFPPTGSAFGIPGLAAVAP